MRCCRGAALAAVGHGLLAAVMCATTGCAPAGAKSRNVVLVLVDGMRWQEVFSGAEEALMTKETGGVRNVEALKKVYWRDTPEARREALMPFLWTVVGRQGQIWGNQNKGSVAQVTNGMKFSYPGYSEMLCGYPDPRIDSNDKKPNANVTVFEWLNAKPAFAGRVAAFGTWDVLPWIFNRDRCGFYVNAGAEPVLVPPVSAEQALLNVLKTEVPGRFKPDPYDAIAFRSALEYLKAHKPRAFFFSFGETDEWGHAGRYDEYLTAATRTDGYLRMLWEWFQSQPQYRGKTTMIAVCDHGRGDGAEQWKNHGKDVAGAENIWIAVIGPDVPADGERSNVPRVTQSQIAASLAAAVGEDYPAAVPKAAPPLAWRTAPDMVAR